MFLQIVSFFFVLFLIVLYLHSHVHLKSDSCNKGKTITQVCSSNTFYCLILKQLDWCCRHLHPYTVGFIFLFDFGEDHFAWWFRYGSNRCNPFLLQVLMLHLSYIYNVYDFIKYVRSHCHTVLSCIE